MNKFNNFNNGLTIGRTGELKGAPRIAPRGQRVRSTCLLEREPVMVKRLLATCGLLTNGKGPKWTDSFKEDVPHLESLRKSLGASDDANQTLRRMRQLWVISAQSKGRAQRLHRLLTDINLWVAAYKKLALNAGSMTKGGAKGTIDGTSLKSLKYLRDLVKSGEFQLGTINSQRVYIPLPKGGRRPLGIPEFRDRLLQEVLRTVLEVVYEPRFSDKSHGFRPGRSQHTCLRQVRRDFWGTKWYIEGDISKCFDTIDHQVIRKCLEKAIDDPKIINLIIKGLKTKVLMPVETGALEWMNRGTPQGGVCSPLLSNVVLHELDRFMGRLARVINRGTRRKQSHGYMQMYNRLKKASTPTERNELRKKARNIGYGEDSQEESFARMSYTRYADDFLIGVIGPKSLASRIKSIVAHFLASRLKFDLNLDNTVISRALGGRIPFLGYIIRHTPRQVYSYTRVYAGKKNKCKAKTHRSGNIILLVDITKVINRLTVKGFCDSRGNPLPNFAYLPHPQSYTITAVNQILRGLANYYKLSDNLRSSLSRINFVMRYSCAKLFAAKYKLRTIAKVFGKAGKDLGKPIKGRGVVPHTSIGSTEEKRNPSSLRKLEIPFFLAAKGHDAKKKAAGGDLIGEMPGMLYTLYRHIPQPDLKPLVLTTKKKG